MTTAPPRTQRTRALLQETATRLFTEQGYDATTVEQIARAAGVSHMTFFRHFPTKDAVVLDDGFDPAIAAAVAGTPPALAPLARVCAGFRAALARIDLPEQEQVRQRVRVAAGHPALRAGMHANTEATREAVVDVLTADGADAFAARVAASAVLAALTVALQEWCLVDDPPADDPTADPTADPTSGATSMRDRLVAALDVLEPSEEVAA